MSEKNNESFLDQARARDQEAFRMLYNRNVEAVYRLSFRMLGNRLEAEEITQDVFVRVYRNLHSFDGRSQFRTWCLQIAVNACYDLLRKRKRRAPFTATWDEVEHLMASDGTAQDDHITMGVVPEDLAAANTSSYRISFDLRKHIETALQLLHEDLRAAFVLRDIEDLSYDEIAYIQGCSAGTVASRLSRARRQVARYLSSVGIDMSYLGVN